MDAEDSGMGQESEAVALALASVGMLPHLREQTQFSTCCLEFHLQLSQWIKCEKGP